MNRLVRAGRAVLLVVLFSVPLAIHAQSAAKTKIWTIGYLEVGRAEGTRGYDAFMQGLRALGYVEGRNVRIERRVANHQRDLLPGLAAELARIPVAVIVAGDSAAILPAMSATKSIPIVMTVSADPVGTGLIKSLGRPGGNVTGLTNISPQLAGKRLQLLREALPGLSRVAVLGPAMPRNAAEWEALAVAAGTLGVQIHRVEVKAASEFEPALKAASGGKADALIVMPSPLTNLHRGQLTRLAAKHRLPAMYPLGEYAETGGLMAYGPDISDLYRRSAVHVDKLLKGAKAAELPVEQPTKFELVLNLKTAKELGLMIPASLRLQADRVIE